MNIFPHVELEHTPLKATLSRFSDGLKVPHYAHFPNNTFFFFVACCPFKAPLSKTPIRSDQSAHSDLCLHFCKHGRGGGMVEGDDSVAVTSQPDGSPDGSFVRFPLSIKGF